MQTMKSRMVIPLFGGIITVLILAGCPRRPLPPTQGRVRESILEKVKRTRVIHAGYIKYPPFVDIDPRTGKLEGYFIDLMDHIVNLMGRDIRIEYEETTWGTMVAGVTSGKFDVVVSGIFSTIPRLMEVTFTRPVLFVGLSAVARKGDTRFKTVEDLRQPGITVAVTAGEVGHDYATKFLPKAKLLVFDTPDITRPMLEVISGRADVGIADSMSCYNFVKAHPNEVVNLFEREPLYLYGTGLMLPRGDPDWKDFLDQAISFLEYSGILEELERKYKKGAPVWYSLPRPYRLEE